MSTIPDRDPWAHRSEGMRCKSCTWFVPKQVQDGITDLGRCRRHAPSSMGFPPVFVNDWCGDHRLDENKVAAISGRESKSQPIIARPQPISLSDVRPGLNDLSPGSHCWWWNDPEQSWELTHHEVLDLGDLWLPYRAIADPSAEP